MRRSARLLILLGALIALGGVSASFVLDLMAIYRSQLGLVGAILGVILLPLTLMIGPWFALVGENSTWVPLAVTMGSCVVGPALYGLGQLLAED